MSETRPVISIIIPAYNEEKYLPTGLAGVKAAMARVDFPVEVIVVNNDSIDRTAAIAENWGARVIFEKEHKIARVRNAGAAAARGDIILTVDADSVMHPDTLAVVHGLMQRDDIVGGSVRIVLNEKGLRITMAIIVLRIVVYWIMRLGGGIYFCRKADFDAIHGFNEQLYAAEDLDFAGRLKAHGRKQEKKYLKEITEIPLLTSSRKFHLVRDRDLWRLVLGLIRSPRNFIRDPNAWNVLFYGDNLR